ncbi:MAG: hypothetical protein QM441_09935 [Synergistota bacterium]|jgi:hypothetical protein|nr:hypothetical protein [Synergistota bacterium]
MTWDESQERWRQENTAELKHLRIALVNMSGRQADIAGEINATPVPA